MPRLLRLLLTVLCLWAAVPNGSVQQIQLTGSRSLDFEEANRLAGLDKTPDGYTWHHVDDYDPDSGLASMELVQSDAHEATYPHFGGAGQYSRIEGHPYDK